jgi:hypothetical protein
MSVRRLPSGIYEFDTVAEAVEFERLCGNNGFHHQQKKLPEKRQKTASKDLQGFIDGLQDHQRKVVNALKNGELTGEELAKKTHTEVNSIGPLLRHLRNRAAEHGLQASEIVLRVKRKDESGKPIVSAYKLGSELAGIGDV